MIKVVLDTNIMVSAFLAKHGKPAKLVRDAPSIELLTSQQILDELARVLNYPRIRKKYPATDEEIADYIARLRIRSTLVTPKVTLAGITADPADDMFVECALAGEADYIVTGDPHLLDLEEYKGTRIVTPARFLSLLNE